MKLTIPTLEISGDEGFTKNDIFARKDFGERLASLVEKSQGNLVISLDAQWGEGKSTFIKMWRGHIEHNRENKIKSIYFDAFANDYQKDPFLTLAAEIYELIKDEPKEKKDAFKKAAGNAAKSLLRGAIKIGIRSTSGGILDGSIVDYAGKDISKLLADQVDEIMSNKLQNTQEDKLAISQFREHLKKFAEQEGNGRPIVFVIDELDRCRPDFALELVEQIKHLFSVQGIVFLLVMNRNQLEEAIKTTYGIKVKAALYLQKFINLWLTLPRKADQYNDDGDLYLNHTLNLMKNDQGKNNDSYTIVVLSELVQTLKPSFREIEQILSYYALIYNMRDITNYQIEYKTIIAFICYLKASKSQLFKEIIENNNIKAEYLFQKTGLNNVLIKDKYRSIDYLLKLIKFCLANDAVQLKMITGEIITFDRRGSNPGNIIKKVCGWFSEITIN